MGAPNNALHLSLGFPERKWKMLNVGLFFFVVSC